MVKLINNNKILKLIHFERNNNIKYLFIIIFNIFINKPLYN